MLQYTVGCLFVCNKNEFVKMTPGIPWRFSIKQAIQKFFKMRPEDVC